MYEDYVPVDSNIELLIEISIDLIEIMHLGSKHMGFNNGNVKYLIFKLINKFKFTL